MTGFVLKFKMEIFNDVEILRLAEVHAKLDKKMSTYGTAGFRAKAVDMDHIFFRMGLFATLRSMCKKATIGIMVTASHNPEDDNGIKLIDPLGEMLEEKWEEYATKLVNVGNECIIKELSKIVKNENIDVSQQASLFLARDTRPSGLVLSQAVKDGISAMGGICKDFGLLTTPQLHYIVFKHNSGETASEDAYNMDFSTAFKNLVGIGTGTLTVDCANGVGAQKLKKISEKLSGSSLELVICNDDGPNSGKLNDKCGADYVKVQQCAPVKLDMKPWQRYASFDGDADRIVYYTLDDDCNFVLIDGDKIAALFCLFIKDCLDLAGVDVKLGIVQTAYANGSSTNYLSEKLGVAVHCARTGVKHLHHMAQDFDIGVYFEANGHGTILVKETCQKAIDDASKNSSLSDEQREAVKKLKNFLLIINQTVGDAICDMLAVEAILSVKQWTVSDWCNLYKEFPNRQRKVAVADRTVIETYDSERRVSKPEGLQIAIDELVKQYPLSRSFVRPSGTEDVVRVYAESDTQEHADALAEKVCLAVSKFAGGVTKSLKS